MTSALTRTFAAGLLAWTSSQRGRLPLEDAEDAVQEACARALERWARDGTPEQTEAWLTRVALNANTDKWRRRGREQGHQLSLQILSDQCPWTSELMPRWDDDLLRLVVTCCDPLLASRDRAALTLATVAGLSNEEIARAFLVEPRTMEQRLTRARRRLTHRARGYEVPARELTPQRLQALLAAVYLLFSEGYWSSRAEAAIRPELTRVALSMSQSLDAMLPSQPEVQGLLALQLLHQARAAARVDSRGEPMTLEEQDRSRWDSATIDEACALLRDALERGCPGPYQIEAAIAAVHCSASETDDTDWLQISLLYEQLEGFRPGPVVRTQRAFAVGQALGPGEGLRLLATVRGDPALAKYGDLHMITAALLEKAGRWSEACEAWQRALALARNDAERRRLQRRLEGASSRESHSPPSATGGA